MDTDAQHRYALPSAPQDGTIGRAVEALDYTRQPPARYPRPGAYKEWHHFVVLAPGIDLLVNFSWCDTVSAAAALAPAQSRLVLLVRTDAWEGDIENFAPEDVRVEGGHIRVALAHNRLEWRDGAFHVTAALRARRVALRLCLTPVTLPVFVPGTPMRDGPPLHWLVVPRLRASGVVTIDGRDHGIDAAPAYHDHNWGHFRWGHDLSWEWGFALPDDSAVPWCLTFVRLTDRARTTALEHKVLVWREAALSRSFRESDLYTDSALEPLRLERIVKAPRPLAILVPDLTADVPRWLETRAGVGDDRVICRCDPVDVVQVLIPSETDLGVTIFNEVVARTTVQGRIGGEPVAFSGRSVMEFIRHV